MTVWMAEGVTYWLGGWLTDWLTHRMNEWGDSGLSNVTVDCFVFSDHRAEN